MVSKAGIASETSQAGRILLVADGSLPPRAARLLGETCERHQILLLDLSPAEDCATGTVPVERLRIDELLDLDAFHKTAIDYLDRWPRETLVDGVPFDDVFRQTTGDSLWWTGPGGLRHPFSGPIVPYLRALWLVREAIRRHRPDVVFSCLSDRRLLAVHLSLCKSLAIDCVTLPGSRRGSKSPSAASTLFWRMYSTAALIALAVWIVLRSFYARLTTKPSSPAADDSPVVVMTGWYPNHVREDSAGKPYVAYWKTLTDALLREHPDVRARYLLHTTTFRFVGWKRVLRPFCSGWRRLRHIDELLPLSQCHPELCTYFTAARHQLSMMRTYTRIERSALPSSAPRFLGADMSYVLIPPLRAAVATMAKWSRNVAATAASIRAAGNVRVVLVHEEFYPKGMLTIAAARSLGVPTMGVQHGLIGPQHTVYMPPRGHITAGPSPDWFAAYGDSAAHVLSELGAYPCERICVVGAPRFDELPSSVMDRTTAREILGWPAGQTVVLLTTETLRLSSPILRALIPVAAEHPDWRFVVKLHPLEREPEAYRSILAETAADNFEIACGGLPERMAACDVLVTGYSTTAVEALLMGKPVVCADFTTLPDRYLFVLERAARGARTAHDLQQALVAAVHDAGPTAVGREFLERHLGPTVAGKAAQAFTAVISEQFLRSGNACRPSKVCR